MNMIFNVRKVEEKPRLKKRALTVGYYTVKNNRTLVLELRVDIDRGKSDIDLFEELAVVICGGMSDFENYKEFNNIEKPTNADKNEYKRQVELFKKIEKFFAYEEPDGSKHSSAIDFAKGYFSDFLYDATDSYFEHSRNLY